MNIELAMLDEVFWKPSWRSRLSAWLLLFAWAAPLGTAEEPGRDLADEVLSLLEQQCVRCHGGEKTRSGLDLTTRERLLKGGDSGPAVLPGQAESSLLMQMVRHEKEPGMPYKEEPLSAQRIEQLAGWIKSGAPYSRTLKQSPAVALAGAEPGLSLSERERSHWSFQPVQPVEPPAVRNASWILNPIDRFILARLERHSLAPAPPASRETLIRRVTLDLIGLPPTPEEIDQFSQDASPGAYAALIDRLLASPRYGERWGRHWLDLARFAETDGFELDAVRPHAWRYRDYVVSSLNADKPYDQFIREQIAGDELYPQSVDALIATGFNLLGPDMVDSADQTQRRLNTLNDMTDNTAFAFLGLTLACARCHDHKFEPLSQKDYFQLQAFYTPVIFRNDLSIAAPEEQARHDQAMAHYKAKTSALQGEIDALEEPLRRRLHEEKLAQLSPEARQAHETPKEERTADQASVVLETAEQIKVSNREIVQAMPEAQRRRHRELSELLKGIPKPAPLPAALALQTGQNSQKKTHVLVRGDYLHPGEEVQPGFPSIFSVAKSIKEPASGDSEAGSEPMESRPAAVQSRSDLARWITSPDHPLTARVMVNRIWQHHFGRGLVSTPSDFGLRGQLPSHPELLDWLASEFVRRGWSLKQMHKLILRSAVYQQSSDCSVETLRRDPENQWYSRWPRKRLEGEVIRDALLAISGRLNLEMGGEGILPPIPKDLFQGAKGWNPSENLADHHRRSIYIFARRNLRFPFLEVFDAPDSNLSCPLRGQSTTAPQSLTLLNADEVLEAIEATAERLKGGSSRPEEQVRRAYRLILGRFPTAEEFDLSREFVQEFPLSELCRALFNLNAFVYVD